MFIPVAALTWDLVLPLACCHIRHIVTDEIVAKSFKEKKARVKWNIFSLYRNKDLFYLFNMLAYFTTILENYKVYIELQGTVDYSQTFLPFSL